MPGCLTAYLLPNRLRMGDTVARRDSGTVLSKARKIFDTARLGLADLEGGDPARRIPGLHNVIVFGRAVTFVLQNLRTVDAGAFDAWYEPRRSEMQTDPLLRYFHRLRNELEKEGGADTAASVYIKHLDTDDLAPLMANPPPGASGFFIGDVAGGSGWEVPLPDGASAKYYVKLPDTISIQTSMHLSGPPSEHLSKPIEDQSAPGLSRLYLAYIDRLLTDAERRFGSEV
jgi:hypothetical protein